MSRVSIAKMREAISRQEDMDGKKYSLLGIGPMSRPVIEAAFMTAKEKDFPLMFIASRNQIDSEKFGGGYVCGWNQRDFVSEIQIIADKVGFKGIYHICRDHGGPWQRDKERNDKLPEAEAMEIGIQSFLEDLEAGFDLLHVDPTKDPHYDKIVPLDLVIKRTVTIIEAVEKERLGKGLPEVSYEVGTEETSGGLTEADAFGDFIRTLTEKLKAKGLPMPVFIVGQTGTLTRLTENVGHFDPSTARMLSETAAEFGIGLKEHNGDYLSDFVLYTHPILGITGINVAPEFGVAETEAYLMLETLENFVYENGYPIMRSGFYKAISTEAVNCERWRKWMVGDTRSMPLEAVFEDEKLVELITQTGGHYTFESQAVKESLAVMISNLERAGLRPYEIVIDRIKRSIARYVECLNLEGLTTKILANL